MIRRCVIAFWAVALVACSPSNGADDAWIQQAPRPATIEPGRLADGPSAYVNLDSLLGQWTVTTLNGAVPKSPIHVMIGRAGVEAVSQCIPFRFRLPNAPEPQRQSINRSEPVCARPLTPDEQAFGAAVARLSGLELVGEDRVRLMGPAGEIVLTKATEPVLNPFQNVPASGPNLMWGEWRIAAINGKPTPDRMRVLFFRYRAELVSGCIGIFRRFTQVPAMNFEPDPVMIPICDRGLSFGERTVEAVLSGKVRIVTSTPRRRLLQGTSGTLLLER